MLGHCQPNRLPPPAEEGEKIVLPVQQQHPPIHHLLLKLRRPKAAIDAVSAPTRSSSPGYPRRDERRSRSTEMILTSRARTPTRFPEAKAGLRLPCFSQSTRPVCLIPSTASHPLHRGAATTEPRSGMRSSTLRMRPRASNSVHRRAMGQPPDPAGQCASAHTQHPTPGRGGGEGRHLQDKSWPVHAHFWYFITPMNSRYFPCLLRPFAAKRLTHYLCALLASSDSTFSFLAK